ncbi:MAG: DNA-binding protein [Nitrososphaeria archaeon]
MSEDEEVDRILKRKMNELIKKQVRPPQQQKIKEDPMTTVSRVLYDRGDEVLNAAMAQFPNETKLVVSKLAELINSNAINYRISGSELLYIFRTMGLPVTIETQIKIERNGRSLSLSDMLKEKQEE